MYEEEEDYLDYRTSFRVISIDVYMVSKSTSTRLLEGLVAKYLGVSPYLIRCRCIESSQNLQKAWLNENNYWTWIYFHGQNKDFLATCQNPRATLEAKDLPNFWYPKAKKFWAVAATEL